MLKNYAIVAIVGRPNVGKSSLFNCLTKTNSALVLDIPGTTVDRNMAWSKTGEHHYMVVDTSGLSTAEQDHNFSEQIWVAVAEATIILFVLDHKVGIHKDDLFLAQKLRAYNKKVIIVVNKTENDTKNILEYYELGFPDVVPVSASHRQGIANLVNIFSPELANLSSNPIIDTSSSIKVCVFGQPNAGKSTLINAFLKDNRVVVDALPGTTRDSITIPFIRNGIHYTLTDTAGIKRRSKTAQGIEVLSVLRAFKTLANSDVALLVIDACHGLTPQDLRLGENIIKNGVALIIVINKCDKAPPADLKKLLLTLEWRGKFLNFAQILQISALKRQGLTSCWKAIAKAYQARSQKHTTPNLTRILSNLIEKQAPPITQGRRIKLRYAHMGGINPPKIIIHGKQLESLPVSYKRYLMRGFRNALGLVGTPVELLLRTDHNPYTKEQL